MTSLEELDLDQISVEKKEQLIDELCQSLFNNSRRAFIPMYPWCFVRVLEKEQLYHGVVHTPGDQNKTIHEGIVIATWKPFTKALGRKREGGYYFQKWVEMQSALEQGQHVLFPHFAGAPISGFDSKKYRVVKELEWTPEKEGGIFATVDYDGVEATEHALLYGKLIDSITHLHDLANDEQAAAMIASSIEDEFFILHKAHQSVTFSGR